MASTTVNEVFPCSIDDFYKIVTDYEKYPEFLSEISHCRIVKEKDNKKLVEYDIQLIKSFIYELWMNENETSHCIDWEFAGGSIFKSNKGYWKLEDLSGRCCATFHIDCQFKIFIPRSITNTLLHINLPNMMKSYHKRVVELYG